jgi:fucose 4-O-acetylase-like acetyltransferase
MKPTRETWIDYARGIAIILVLYRHVFEGIKNAGIQVGQYLLIEHINIMFFSFRMPLFFIVSGIFLQGSLNKRGLKGFIATKAKTILYPFFLWGILQITLQLILKNYVNSNRTIYSYLDLLYMPRGIDQFWYLYALFNVSVIYALFCTAFKCKPATNIFIGAIFFYISILVHQANITLGFLDDILHYYLFYSIGDLLSKSIRDKNKRKYLESWKLLLFMLVPFLLGQYYFLKANLPYSTMKYEYVEYYEPLLFIPIALIGCTFILMLSFFLQEVKAIPWLHALGRHSLYIYVSHVMVIAAVRILMTRVFGIYNVPLLFFSGILLGLLIPVLIYTLACRLNMKWLFTLEKNEEAATAISTIKLNKIPANPLQK